MSGRGSRYSQPQKTSLLSKYINSLKAKTSTKVITGVVALTLVGSAFGGNGGTNTNTSNTQTNTDKAVATQSYRQASTTTAASIQNQTAQQNTIDVETVSTPQTVQPVDKSALESLIIEAWSYDGSHYTPETYQNMMSYVASDSYQAKVYNDPNATQHEVDVAAASLRTAINGLVWYEPEPVYEEPTYEESYYEPYYEEPASWEWTAEAPIVYYAISSSAYAYHSTPNCSALSRSNVASCPMDQLPFNITQRCSKCW